MATWIIHLRVGQKVAEKLSGLDETAYYVGNIAPDSGRMVDDFTYLPPKDVSHWKRDGVSYEQRFEDNAEFYKKFVENEKDNFKRSFLLGYYVHVLTDTIFVRDIIHPFIDKHGKPFWRANITAIRDGWYQIDHRFLANNKGYYPLELLKNVSEFPNTYFDYFEKDDIYERIRYAVDFYGKGVADYSVPMITHDESKADELVEYMSETIIDILKNKHCEK